MVRIGVLSDTHIEDVGQGFSLLARLAESCFRQVDIILHAGDVVNADILTVFSDRSVYAVRGNMDPATSGIPDRKVIKVEGFRIGLVHGWGPPGGIEDRVLRQFAGERLDCLVYGHSHYPACHRRNGILLFNPGSPTDRRRAPFHSVGILEVGENIIGRVIDIDRL